MCRETFKRNFAKERKIEIIIIMIFGTLFLILFYFDLIYWSLIPLSIFIVFIFGLIKAYKYHRQLNKWIEKHHSDRVFIYSSKTKYNKIIENEILPNIEKTMLICKNDNAVITGDIPRSIYYELHSRIVIKDLPILLIFNGYKYNKIFLKPELDKIITNELNVNTLLTLINSSMYSKKYIDQ